MPIIWVCEILVLDDWLAFCFLILKFHEKVDKSFYLQQFFSSKIRGAILIRLCPILEGA